MADPRIFISYAQESSQDTQFAHRLIDDLCKAELEPITLEEQQQLFTEENFAQTLNEKLSDCQWVILVLTPEALQSPHVQLTINAALNLALQKRIRGVLSITPEPIPTQEIPPTWTTLRTFDASEDYSRALTRLLLALQTALATTVPTVRVKVAPPPTFQAVAIEEPAQTVPAQAMGAISDKPLPLAQASWFRYKRMQRWAAPLAIVLVVILIVTVSMTTFARSLTVSPTVAASTPAQIKTPTPLPTATPDIAATATTMAAATATSAQNAKATVTAQNIQATQTALNIMQARIAANATANANANATATANANAKATANANATATAVAMDPMTILRNATQQQPALSDPLNGPDGNNWDTQLCSFNNGSYVVNTTSRTICLANGSQFGNFAFQVQMTFMGNPAACGLVFRAQAANLSSYRIYFATDGTYEYDGYQNAQGAVEPQISGAANSISANQANTITVVAMNNVFYFYANGTFVTAASSSANGAASGAIGFVCHLDQNIPGMTSSAASFQSASVWTLP